MVQAKIIIKENEENPKKLADVEFDFGDATDKEINQSPVGDIIDKILDALQIDEVDSYSTEGENYGQRFWH